MARIDEIKEFLTTLRVFFTVSIAIMVTIGGSLISAYRKELFDVVFWLGFISEIVLMVAVVFIVKKIKEKTKEIREL